MPRHHPASAPRSRNSSPPQRQSGSISPVFADLTGLPPLLIQVGGNEILLDDSIRLAARAAADNVKVTLDVTPGVPHVFPAFAGLLAEADTALDSGARFIRSNL
jgi:epsilon-lactone hydrolase